MLLVLALPLAVQMSQPSPPYTDYQTCEFCAVTDSVIYMPEVSQCLIIRPLDLGERLISPPSCFGQSDELVPR